MCHPRTILVHVRPKHRPPDSTHCVRNRGGYQTPKNRWLLEYSPPPPKQNKTKRIWASMQSKINVLNDTILLLTMPTQLEATVMLKPQTLTITLNV